VVERTAFSLFTTGVAMSAATAVRTGVGCLELWSEQAPKLMRLGLDSFNDSADARRAEGELRDELIATARRSTEIVLHELQRGIDDLDTFTRPDEEPAEHASRPYKAKP
jgi:hypothetical protein